VENRCEASVRLATRAVELLVGAEEAAVECPRQLDAKLPLVWPDAALSCVAPGTPSSITAREEFEAKRGGSQPRCAVGEAPEKNLELGTSVPEGCCQEAKQGGQEDIVIHRTVLFPFVYRSGLLLLRSRGLVDS